VVVQQRCLGEWEAKVALEVGRLKYSESIISRTYGLLVGVMGSWYRREFKYERMYNDEIWEVLQLPRTIELRLVSLSCEGSALAVAQVQLLNW
jgi:hypothetical protein